MVHTIIIILIIIAAILLGLVVLMQNSKGGGLTETFAASSQVMGVRKTTDFMEKLTWGLAISIVVLCFLSSMIAGSRTGNDTVKSSKGTQAQSTTGIPVPEDQMPTADPTHETGPVVEE